MNIFANRWPEREARMIHQHGSQSMPMRPSEGGSGGREVSGETPKKNENIEIPEAVRALVQGKEKSSEELNAKAKGACQGCVEQPNAALVAMRNQIAVTPESVRKTAQVPGKQEEISIVQQRYDAIETQKVDERNKAINTGVASGLELAGMTMVFPEEEQLSQTDPTAPRYKDVKTKIPVPNSQLNQAPAIAAQSAPQKEKSAPAPQVAAAETPKKENPQEPEDPKRKDQKKVA